MTQEQAKLTMAEVERIATAGLQVETDDGYYGYSLLERGLARALLTSQEAIQMNINIHNELVGHECDCSVCWKNRQALLPTTNEVQS